MLVVVTQANESGLKEVKSERDLLPQKTFSTKGTNTEIAAVGSDRFLTWLFNKAYNVCIKEKERTLVEGTDVNLMTVVSPQQAVEGEEDDMEVSEKCGDDIVDISVRSYAASDDHEIELICTADTEALPSQSDHQLDKSQDRNVCASNKTLPMQTRKRKLTENKKVVDHKKRKGTQALKEKTIKVLKCTYCLKTFKSKRNLTLHRREHSTKQLYTTKIYKMKSTMQSNYLKIHTGEKEYKCTVCDKAFSTKGNLKRHLRIHTGEKPNKCTVCEKLFSTKSNLEAHFRIHTGEKPYKCTVCDKAIRYKHALKRHLRIHSGERPYKCTACDKGFTENGTLNRHLRIHSGEKPYKCTVCDKAFSAKGDLNKHFRIHTGEKPYKCTVCDKAFSTKGNLKRHLRIHTGEKPYKCTICDKAFSAKGDLNKHSRIHTREKRYKCTACNIKAFKDKRNLQMDLVIHSKNKVCKRTV